MLTFILQAFSFIKSTTYLGLLISYKTGQLIIHVLKTLIDLLLQAHKNIEVVLRVLLEDFYVFLCDVGQKLWHIVTITNGVIQSIIDCFIAIYGAIKFVILTLQSTVCQIHNAVFSVISKVLSGIGQMFVALKYFILLLGSGIWFAITIIPLFIIYMCTMFAYYLSCLIGETIGIVSTTATHCKMFVSNLYEFLTDVPLESMVGLIAGTCILYVIIKFQILLYEKILSALELTRYGIERVRLRLTRITIRRSVQLSSSESEDTESSDESNRELVEDELNEDRLCLICQERVKCVLLLPCRHICLCTVCNTRLRYYNRTCPICRTLVQETLKVFV